MAESTVLITALGIVATCVGGLIWVIKYMFEQIMPMLEKINASIDKNTKVTIANTKTTEANQEYLRKRNGSDGRKWEDNTAALKQLTTSIKKLSTEDV